MITEKSVWNTKTRHYIDEHDNSREDPSRQYVIDFIKREMPKSVLELGIGSGVFIDAIDGYDIKYTGIDASYKFINYVKKNYPYANIIEHDLDNKLPVDDNSFQLVYARHTLEHINNPDIISELARVAQEDVIIVLFRPLLKADEINFKEHKGAYYNSYSESRVRKELAENFREFEIKDSYNNYNSPSKDGRNWIIHAKR